MLRYRASMKTLDKNISPRLVSDIFKRTYVQYITDIKMIIEQKQIFSLRTEVFKDVSVSKILITTCCGGWNLFY